MKKLIVAVLFCLVLGAYGTPACASGFTGNVNVLLAQKQLDDDDWGSLDEQNEFGILIDFAPRNWPINIAIDLLGSKEDTNENGADIEGKTSELCLGVRKIFLLDRSGMFKPYIGGGLAFIRAEIETEPPYTTNTTVSDDDSAAGIWLNGGAYFTLSQHFNIGLDLRYSKAEVTLFDNDVEAGGTHVGLLVGYHW